MIGTNWDITNEKKADLAKAEFVSTVSHELRTPLSLIKGYRVGGTIHVIVNNQVQTPARTVQPGWISVVQRSVEVAIRASTVTSLRHLLSFAQTISLRGDADVEVRWIAIPEEWRPPVEGVFVKETMNDLVDLGRRLGADPSSWRRGDP
jgi:signal transduction histidine kinase